MGNLNFEKSIVGYPMEYADDLLSDRPHRYIVYYILGDKNFQSKQYGSYSQAFDVAMAFADKVLAYDKIPDSMKVQIIRSISVYDFDMAQPVTTTELRNALLDKIKDLR